MAETDQDKGGTGAGTALKKWKFYNNGRTWKFSLSQNESAYLDLSHTEIQDVGNNVSNLDQKFANEDDDDQRALPSQPEHNYQAASISQLESQSTIDQSISNLGENNESEDKDTIDKSVSNLDQSSVREDKVTIDQSVSNLGQNRVSEDKDEGGQGSWTMSFVNKANENDDEGTSPSKPETQGIGQSTSIMEQKLLTEDNCLGASTCKPGSQSSISDAIKKWLNEDNDVIDLTEISDDEENMDTPKYNESQSDVEIIKTIDNVKVIEAVKSVDGACLGTKKKLELEVQKNDSKINKDTNINCDDEKEKEEDDSLEMGLTAGISDIVDLSVHYNNQPKFDETTQKVMDVLPNVDPNHIQKKVMFVTQRFPGRQVDPNIIADELMNEPNVPQKRLNNQEIKDLDVEKASKMTASDFLDKYADPHSHFSSIHRNVSDTYKLQAEHHLNRLYSVHGEAVQKILESNNFHLFPTVLMLENKDPGRGKQPQQNLPERPERIDPLFVEEVVYCRLACYVRQHQKKLKNIRKKKIATAQIRGEILPECSKCDRDHLNEEVIKCSKNHPTCKMCIMKSVQKQETYEGQVRCQCGEVLPSKELKQLLPSRMMDQLERQSTNQCPLCTGPGIQKSRNVYVCAVVECGKEFCNLCWKDNHPNRNCGDKQANHQEENDMFSLIGQWDAVTKQGDEQIFYRKKLEASGRRKINSTNKFDNLYRLAEGHYLKMLARDTYALNAQMRPTGPVNNNNFHNNIPKCIEIVVNKELEKKFKSQKDEFKKNGLPHDEILAFHGTNQQSADSILLNNFRFDIIKHAQVHGRGVYLSEFPNFARRYGDVLLLCRVLPGHEYVGDQLGVPQGWNSKKVRPSTDEYGEQILVDNVDQILPVFLIYINSSPPQNPGPGVVFQPQINPRMNLIPYRQVQNNPPPILQAPTQTNSLTILAQNNPLPVVQYGQTLNNPPIAHQQPAQHQTPQPQNPIFQLPQNIQQVTSLPTTLNQLNPYLSLPPPPPAHGGLGFYTLTPTTTHPGSSVSTQSPNHTPPPSHTQPPCKRNKLG